MRDFNWSHVVTVARGAGKTAAMVEAVESLAGVLVVRNKAEANRIKREYEINCVSINEPGAMYGETRPFFFDPDAVGLICMEYEREIDRLNEELAKSKAKAG